MKKNITLPYNNKIVLKGYHWPQSEFDKLNENQIFYLALNFTSKCNLRCPYCFVGHKCLNRDYNELLITDKKRLITEGKKLGAKVLVIPGRGEPFLDKDFWEIIDFANDLGIWVVVYTNGGFLNSKTIERLKQAQISLYIKVDSFKETIYDELVGLKGTFKIVKGKLDYLLKTFHKPEIINGNVITRIGLNSVITKQSVDSIPEIYNFCKRNNIYYTCRSPVKVGQADETWEYLTGNKANILRQIGKKYSARNFTSATPNNQCGIYRFGITVENNGDIYMCPDAREYFEPIGNIKDKSLSELIEIRNKKYPLNSEPGYCFVKAHRNPEEKIRQF